MRRSVLLGTPIVLGILWGLLGAPGCGGSEEAPEAPSAKIRNLLIQVDGTNAEITWKTDLPARGEVRYWPEDNEALAQTASTPEGTEHAVSLTGLEPEKNYKLEVRAITAAGEVTRVSRLFGAGAAGSSEPRLLNVETIDRGDSVNLSLNFNESVRIVVQYGSDPERLRQTLRNDRLDVAHAITLSDLSAGSEYFWRVIATDADGNKLTTEPQSVQTSGGGDTGPSVKVIRITASQWKFTPGTIRVPEGTTVRIILTTADVAHGFGLAKFGANVNINPGKEAVVEFEADRAGEFPFICTVPCGAGHANMKGTLIVE